MFSSLKIKMGPEPVFGLFLRFCLLACAALFMVKVLEEFLNGNTGYATSKESLSQTDIPTVMFCHSRNDDSKNVAYEKDFYITFVIRRRPDYKSVKLVLDRKVETLYGLNISLRGGVAGGAGGAAAPPGFWMGSNSKKILGKTTEF